MRLIDTVAVIGFLNPKDRAHARSIEHVSHVTSHDDTFVPMISLVEADLVMKIKGYEPSEREVSWRALESRIPTSRIISNSVSSLYSALELQEQGMDYFDSLITSLALETGSIVITTDKVIAATVQTEW
jgi:PIN domain nuclease of toxin-antitoxin system